MNTLLQALANLARLRWLGAAFCALAMLCSTTHTSALARATTNDRVSATITTTTTTSASAHGQTKTRVGGLEQNPPLNICANSLASAETHRGISSAQREAASAFSHAAEGTSLARQLGTEGEVAAGIVKNTERIESLSGTASYRIPDALNHDLQILGEVKNVSSLSYTNQLRDFAAYSQQNGYQFYLWVRPMTQLSGPLSVEVTNGNIILRFLQ